MANFLLATLPNCGYGGTWWFNGVLLGSIILGGWYALNVREWYAVMLESSALAGFLHWFL